MTTLRALLTSLLIFALLPWGGIRALTGPAAATAAPLVIAAQGHPGDTGITAPAKLKCRIAHLPGSPCGPDLFLRLNPLGLGPAAAQVILSPFAQTFARMRGPAPPREPPRLI